MSGLSPLKGVCAVALSRTRQHRLLEHRLLRGRRGLCVVAVCPSGPLCLEPQHYRVVEPRLRRVLCNAKRCLKKRAPDWRWDLFCARAVERKEKGAAPVYALTRGARLKRRRADA